MSALFRIVLHAERHPVDPLLRLRQLLKRAGRDHALRCVEVAELSDEDRTAMKMSKEFPGRFMKASDLDGPVPYTIRDVTKERLQGRNGPEDKPVLWLTGTKQGLPLNVTNRRVMIGAFGDDTDAWLGQRITLDRVQVRGFDGDLVDSIVIEIPETVSQPAPRMANQLKGRRSATTAEVAKVAKAAVQAQAPLDDDPELAGDPIQY